MKEIIAIAILIAAIAWVFNTNQPAEHPFKAECGKHGAISVTQCH